MKPNRTKLHTLRWSMPSALLIAAVALPGQLRAIEAATGSPASLSTFSEAVVRQGVVTGQVTDATTMAPLSGVQVVVQGTDRGTLTDGEGRFRIDGVPAGTHTVTAIMIGYTRQEHSVEVASGGSAAVDFALESAFCIANFNPDRLHRLIGRSSRVLEVPSWRWCVRGLRSSR